MVTLVLILSALGVLAGLFVLRELELFGRTSLDETNARQSNTRQRLPYSGVQEIAWRKHQIEIGTNTAPVYAEDARR